MNKRHTMSFQVYKMKNNHTTPSTTKTTNKPTGGQRPTCSVPGCTRPAVQIAGKNDPRYPLYRRSLWIKEKHPEATDIWCCGKHHRENIALTHNVKSASHLTAKRQGKTLTEYRNQYHPYLQHRKDYCENVDGRLGYTCNYIPPTEQELIDMGLEPSFKGWLQVDHIDGNPNNNDLSNLQTLCACCHNLKTYKNKDYSTIGRATIKKLKSQGFVF